MTLQRHNETLFLLNSFLHPSKVGQKPLQLHFNHLGQSIEIA